MKITLGSRGSQLSQKQTGIIVQKLLRVDPTLEIEVKIVSTKGDKNHNPIPLDSVGKGWFTKEIDRSLLNRTIDLAVHSFKDLPETLPEGIIICAVPEREDPREVLIAKKNLSLDKLPKGAIIGTDSNRRKAQLLHKRPDLIIKSIRGNVDTRLEKLYKQEYDAIILAAAGLIRLGLQNNITQYFEINDIIPSPGQGALAVVTRKTDKQLCALLSQLSDQNAVLETTAERVFSSAIGGGCKTPVGAVGLISNDTLTVYGMVATQDGKFIEKDVVKGKATDATKLGKLLAKKLLKKATWYKPQEIN